MATNKVYEVTEVGVFTPKPLATNELRVVVIILHSSKMLDARVGDTMR